MDQKKLVAGLGEVAVAGSGDLHDAEVVGLLGILLGQRIRARGAGIGRREDRDRCQEGGGSRGEHEVARERARETVKTITGSSRGWVG